uniref:HECT-type E3 ubiquitin transferase n=1 Tax=Saccoglossus kowalevskii TaxID=10224 RepID=A0ABM0MNA8_SACKO|nr:PREDICTED: apoptosis-resistant E3 ubiquitin protein ligase 1-like [Saccoglossus kowalevskii]
MGEEQFGRCPFKTASSPEHRVADTPVDCKYLEELAGIDVETNTRFQHLDTDAKMLISFAIQLLQDELNMKEWLEGKGLQEYLDRSNLKELHQAKNQVDFRSEAWRHYVRATRTPKMTFLSIIFSIILFVILLPILIIIICKNLLDNPRLLFSTSRSRRTPQTRLNSASFLNYIIGSFLDPNKCRVQWGWSDTPVVGDTLTFTISCHRNNGTRYPISSRDNLSVNIHLGDHKIDPIVEIGSEAEKSSNMAKVTYTVHRAGRYAVSVKLGGVDICGSPFEKTVNPGEVVASNTSFLQHSSTFVVTQGEFNELAIEPRDEFGNICDQKLASTFDNPYEIQVTEVGELKPETFSPVWQVTDEVKNKIMVHIKMPHTGCYKALATYQGKTLKNGEFNILVLNETDAGKVKKNVAKKSLNIWYEAYLLRSNNERHRKLKKVFCYISPKQLTIKEFYLRIIPKRLYTFRVCPATKFQFFGVNNESGHPMFTIDDGSQPQLELASKERDILAATFTQFLLKNIGGSETFHDKQDFFFREVRQIHTRRNRSKMNLTIKRSEILESSMKATKYFTTSDWCKHMEITFVGEEGLDWGGVRREWFEILCLALFSPENHLFTRFKEDNQGLVHPNPNRPHHLAKQKYFEFAGKIVGKCLYESAMGLGYRQLVKARFTRSFLAQLIGLRVNYRYFETDDPDTYVTKIKYIEENDVDNLDLVFAEEEYNSLGEVEKIVELLPDGSNIPVTNQNKMRYLNMLAHYKFTNSVSDEIEHFLKGLNDIIPDHLLSIFDENELELLMCGSSSFDLDDFKRNCVINSGGGYNFRKIIGWFWTIVASFTQEEMARLLQFTTGCSQLPPGGFSDLSPRFQISASPTYCTLPTAHTCFNQLCLPSYDSIEQMQKALLVAINEGSEGFGLV